MDGIWKYATTALGSILIGLLMSNVLNIGQQRQLDSLNVEIIKLQDHTTLLELAVARIQTQESQVSIDIDKIASHLGIREESK